KLSIQLHQPTGKAQNGPNARRVHVTYPPSSGSAAASSDMARATGRLQKSGVSSSSASVIPGPNAGTMSSMPYGPPLTLKKKMAAIGTSPSSRLRPPFRSRPLCRGDELRELLHPLLDRAGSVHDDLELAARQPAHPAGHGRAQRDDQHLPVDAKRIGHREDRVDLLQSDDLKHRRRAWSRWASLA